ncbi:MAG TPA: NAD(P)/FAD-dependent oxidoreductase [Gaiellaceae bacterium]|nr:NAD(P)/FAD-dependent oxidoreductase [Gaiellaceae bacterium]
MVTTPTDMNVNTSTSSKPADAAAVANVVVVGAGPAGLTAAYELTKRDVTVTVLEADVVVGGLARTVERDGWRFDIGGHRFFTKVTRVEDLWHELLPDDLLLRPRMSRIYYGGKFFDYPLKAGNALRNLGLVEAARCVLSYVGAWLRPPRDQSTFEGWTAARFGWRLYRVFFKTYTEKVWGVPATEIQADWAAQRIKNLSLGSAIFNALRLRRGGGNRTEITSLIEQFLYPRLGPGMMWERCHELVAAAGGIVALGARVVRICHVDGRAFAVESTTGSGPAAHQVDHVISSMPLPHLVLAMDPPPPDDVRRAAEAIGYRDFLTVALVVPVEDAFPDNWIYVHAPEVRLGRVQNFGSWSPDMVKPGRTCLGLEYFVFEGDDLWDLPDDELIEFGTSELITLGLLRPGRVKAGYVIRMPLAYPVYDEAYQRNVDVLRRWLHEVAANVHPVGRNGMHRYNNQDHSMYAAMLTVENICDGASHDAWTMNVDEYHEVIDGAASGGTGRDAPVLPRESRR